MDKWPRRFSCSGGRDTTTLSVSFFCSSSPSLAAPHRLSGSFSRRPLPSLLPPGRAMPPAPGGAAPSPPSGDPPRSCLRPAPAPRAAGPVSVPGAGAVLPPFGSAWPEPGPGSSRDPRRTHAAPPLPPPPLRLPRPELRCSAARPPAPSHRSPSADG